MPSWMWPEASSEITVPATKSASGSLMGGSRIWSDEKQQSRQRESQENLRDGNRE